jgi:hypothetical protein
MARNSMAYSEVSDMQEKLQELAEEHTEPASIWDIFKFAKPEHNLIFIGLIATAIRGCVWPAFSVIYGQLFKSLSKSLETENPNIDHQITVVAILFVSLGLLSAIATFNSGFMFGKTGEKLTMRLRLESFKVSKNCDKLVNC